jgi:FkbM family methyltransferase
VCFEPDPGNAVQLRHNLATNGYAGSARVVEAAVSDGPERLYFERAEENSGDGRIRSGSPRAGRFNEERRAVIEVRGTTLDRCVAEGALTLDRVKLVWIDVQGHEARVLRGAKRLLGAGVPLVFELWPYGLRRSDGLEALIELAAGAYRSAIDLRDGSRHDPRELGNVAARLRGVEYTDILLHR